MFKFFRLGRSRSIASVLLVIIMLLLVCGTPGIGAQGADTGAPAASEPFEVGILPPEALIWYGGDNVKVRAARNPKLDSQLADLAERASVSPALALAEAKSAPLRLDGERVHVLISTHADGLQAATQAVIAAGGEVTKTGADGTLIQGWLPVTALDAVTACEDVFMVRPPEELVLLEQPQVGGSTTEALGAMNANTWHTAGYRGTGVKIAIIDGGFEGYPDLLGSDLPASVTVRNFVDGETAAQVNGGGDHGTSCAEIIHDVAPKATLYLVKIATALDLAEAVQWLINTARVDVISTSIGWINVTPGDGTGFFANLVTQARNAGIFWATAAGNSRLEHWGGAYYDPKGKNTHYYNETQNVNYFGPGNGNLYEIPAGYLIRVTVRWDDWVNVNQDYDLHLVRWNGSEWKLLKSSTNYQTGGQGQSPTELASAYSTGSATYYGFVIERYSSTRAVNLEVFAVSPADLDERVYARSLANLADARDAMTVAALDVAAPYPQEYYSSQGPTNGPGGTAQGGFIKPDIAGYANVSTQSAGVKGFNGTSSATPHVAGAAALVLSAFPSHSPAQVQAVLSNRAVDMGTAGKDNIFGYGRLHMGKPPTSGSPRVLFMPLLRK